MYVLLLVIGETSKMTLVESLRDAMDITLSKDSTSSKHVVFSQVLSGIV